MPDGGPSKLRTRAICGALAFVLLAISAYVYSGFHRHDPFANRACSFSQFERCGSVEPGGHVEFNPPVMSGWRAPERDSVAQPSFHSSRPNGRAPPFCS